MLNSTITSLLIGTVLGFLSGLGIGGGSLLILWLTVILDTDPLSARFINLLFFIPSATVACIIRKRKGTLALKPLVPALIAGCVSAAVFSRISLHLDTKVLRTVFGAVLIAAGVRELFFKNKEKGSSS